MDRKLCFFKKEYFPLEGNLRFQTVDDLFDKKKKIAALYKSLPNSRLTLLVEEYYPSSAILKTKDTSKVPFGFISVTHPVFAS